MNRRKFISTTAAGSAATLSVAQSAAAAQIWGTTVGIAPHEENAMEFLARSEQNGPDVTHFGYFTHIAGLEDEALYTNPDTRTEATARFTFLSKTRLNARHELGNIIVTGAKGELRIYFNQTPGGDFSSPDSFTPGEKVAVYALRYHNVLNVQAPNAGVLNATSDLIQLRADAFWFDRRLLRFGRRGLAARISASGQGTRTQPDPLQAFFLIGGNIVITEP